MQIFEKDDATTEEGRKPRNGKGKKSEAAKNKRGQTRARSGRDRDSHRNVGKKGKTKGYDVERMVRTADESQ